MIRRIAAAVFAAALISVAAGPSFAQSPEDAANRAGLALNAATIHFDRMAFVEKSRYKKQSFAAPAAPQLPPGTPKKYASMFNDGWQETMELLKSRDCRKFFAGHGDDLQAVLRMLSGTEYRFLNLGSSNVGAETVGPGSVFINTAGVFVTAQDGRIMLDGRHYDLESLSRLRGMILLHELGHELGFFGVDAGRKLEEVNAGHSLAIIHSCLPADGMPQDF
ncbi:MAG TPA: hypothetical protein VNH15_03225 [Elusimicrobiota bacterium]|nr:hypothetical protein [Elusimicrobiota bacterium]